MEPEGPSPGPRRSETDGAWISIASLVWFLTGAPVLLFVAFSADIPSGPRFEAPGDARVRLDRGTYVVYLEVTSGPRDGRVVAGIEVAGPDGRPITVERTARAPDLTLDHERHSTIRDHGRFVAPAQGEYRVAVDTAEPRTVVVNPPWSSWRSWWPALLAAGSIVGPLLALGVVSQLAERRRLRGAHRAA